ncbi:MAG TPA: multiheme c-type cytochrome [Polyangiaceae bacterium]|nr:multiheme c-type cytochrome [Polyangiaceae bacterium]
MIVKRPSLFWRKARSLGSDAAHAGAVRPSLRLISALVFVILASVVSCRCRPSPVKSESAQVPSLRLVLLSSVAGALEPCGCVKDMLGGIDHAAAYLSSSKGPPSLVLGAGPMLFMDPVLHPERRTQDVWKAETMNRSLASMGLKVWAPAVNDFAAGSEELARIAALGARPLSANLKSQGLALEGHKLFRVGGVSVGVAAASAPKHLGKSPPGVELGEVESALQQQARELAQKGAQLRVVLLALPRGEALRVIEKVPDFQIALIGKAVDQGESNDPVTPTTRVGNTLVVESPNHLQGFYVVDLFLRDGKFELENGDARSDERAALEVRIRELEQRIAQAEATGNVQRSDLDARRADLTKLRDQRARLTGSSRPAHGSYYQARLVEVRESLGTDPGQTAQLSEYYKRVNEHNRVAFRDRVPAAPAADESGYVGVQVCGACHTQALAVWQKTRHSRAYETLVAGSKQYNLDCVGCHVTGYEKPGGSTVAHVGNLASVQCEVCHGPGSRHIASVSDKTLIVAKPDPGLCAANCHHEPHVHPSWNVAAALPKIIQPGHGISLAK